MPTAPPKLTRLPLTSAEVLESSYLPLSHACMSECKQAAQLMGAFYQSKNWPTFYDPLEVYAAAAQLPLRTAKRNIKVLVQHGWLDRHGRQGASNGGRKRRTVTYTATEKARKQKRPFAQLPLWAADHLKTWGERALFACIVNRSQCKKRVAGETMGDEDFAENMQEPYTIETMMRHTGLCRQAVIDAKERLSECARPLIVLVDCEWSRAHYIYLNDEMSVPWPWF